MIYLIKSWLSLLKHVSQQCSSTLSTVVESNLIFIMHETLEFQIFFIWWQLLQASASFLSLSFTVLSIEVPRYLNLLTTRKVLLVLELILLGNSLLYIKTLVFFSFNCSATFDDSCYTHVVTAFAPGEYPLKCYGISKVLVTHEYCLVMLARPCFFCSNPRSGHLLMHDGWKNLKRFLQNSKKVCIHNVNLLYSSNNFNPICYSMRR